MRPMHAALKRLMAPALLAALALLAAPGCSVRLKYTGGAKPVETAEVDGWLRAAPTPVVRQRAQRDCGLAALAMVAGAWGMSWTVDDLAREVTATERGVRLGALRDLARARGLEAYAIRGAQADLERELAQGRPVLLGLVLPFQLDRALGHYEVAVALDPRDGSVVTLDPATGRRLRRTRQVLEAEWEPAGRATLVVVGPKAAIRSPARRDSVAARWPSPSSTTPR
jgi:ATP-binding cassette subfamily B protein RaxB